jgi:hypothetical protein
MATTTQTGGNPSNDPGPFVTISQNDEVGSENSNAPRATITQGPVNLDFNAQYTPDGGANAITADFFINSHYEKDGHRYMAGITSPDGFAGDSVAFFQLASPTLLWVVEWTVLKIGETPPIPNPYGPTVFDLGSPNPTIPRWVLLDDHYNPAMITVAPDGVSALYRLSGSYVYGCKNPSVISIADLEFSRPPWLADVFTRRISPGNLRDNLITSTF